MTDTQENKFSSYLVTETVIDQNITTWEPVQSFSDIANKVKSIITDIREKRQIQELNNTSLTENKHDVAAKLIEETLKLLYALVSYAVYSGKKRILSQVNYTESEIRYIRDTILYDRALLIQRKAREYETDLGAYLITPEDISKQNETLTEYATTIAEKSAANTVTKTATEDLKAKFHEMDTLLKEKLDRLILIFKATNPEFVQQYFNSRIIIDLGHRKSTTGQTLITGTVTDAVTGQPLNQVAVSVQGTQLIAYTGPAGLFSIDVGKTGDYTLLFSLLNYKTDSESVRAENGAQVNIDVDLDPIS
ncbi:MAG: carboxypeptidase-like regulatory domain-containing protein [Bacteroidales bacterium]|nr:carboxypeptidase-like regulatory domain-containing protein [Bacteroidales bacterium]